ncbi:hypothetical protein BY458DRAFT_504032 [Sporodiniella umbellata]|nr:hypothetical protein BY458DRAFT_504032 [Sporodiniella umbellata]
MSGLTAFLQTELLMLSSEARRKHPEIKDAAERLGVILRSFKERPGYSIANELSKTDDALRPFILACETKQTKLITIAIGCIQKLILFHAVPETSIRTILRTLTDISSQGVDIQLKILQTVLPLLSNYRSVHDDILAEALLVCFRLQDSKAIVVNNTAAATLRQLVIFVFDKVAKEDTQDMSESQVCEVEIHSGEKIKLHPCAKDAYYLFQDLCLLTNGDSPEYLRLNHLSKPFGLELIESILANHFKLFKEHKELCGILKERVCPMFIRNFSEKNEFPQTMRLTRVVDILIKQFSDILVMECEVFLSMFVKILEPENPLWLRVLAMEVFNSVCYNAALTRSIYEWYDKTDTATNIFQGMITGFGRLGTEKPHSVGVHQSGRDSMDGSATGHVYSSQIATTTPEGLSATSSVMRIKCIDQLDKAEPPTIPETYIFYLALQCLNAIADGLAGFALPRFSSGTGKAILDKEESKQELDFVAEMANVAWPGLLAAMSFYLTANLDDDLFQSTMKSYQNFTNVCGVLDLVTPRDAFLTNLCKNAIPLMPILSSGTKATATHSVPATSFSDLPAQQQQALAGIYLNEKNLYNLRILLNVTMFLSNVMDSSWYLVLETFQLADLLLFNRPLPKSSSNNTSVASTPALRRNLTSSSITGGSSSSIPTSKETSEHASVIGASLQRLFENSKFLDDSSFIAFTTALCRLSSEVSGVPSQDEDCVLSHKSSRVKIYNNKSFAIEKLLYISVLNIKRLVDPKRKSFDIWNIVLNHMISTANYLSTPAGIRAQSCEAIAEIIMEAMNSALLEYEHVDEAIQRCLLLALNQCIVNVPHNEEASSQDSHSKALNEVQRMGLETLHNILQTSGHSFTCGWGLIFDMLRHVAISAIDVSDYDLNLEQESRSSTDTIQPPSLKTASTGSIRTAFTNLQLICTDFLSLLSPECLRQCIATLGSFSMQSEDLNISLTAVGLLWNISDYIQTKRMEFIKQNSTMDETLYSELNSDQNLTNADPTSPTTYGVLWMMLLLQLSHTCTDSRPEVRNGANQTLFRTISMNGQVLGSFLWESCIWKVLFPLLDSIKMSSIRASKMSHAQTASLGDHHDSSGFMLHHSRDTADKQWDETKVLILIGISSLFQSFLGDIYELESFAKAFTLLLAHLEDSCLRSSQEVALASIKSLKSIIDVPADFDGHTLLPLWHHAWQTWQAIGHGINKTITEAHTSLEPELQSLTLSLSTSSAAPISDDFTQDTLTAYASTFTVLYPLISNSLTLNDVSSLLDILRNLLVYSTSPQYRPDIDHVSPLQEAVLEAVKVLDMDLPGTAPLVISDLAEYMTLAFLSTPQQAKGYIPPSQRKFSTVTYIALNKHCSQWISELFLEHINNASIYTDGVFEKIIGSYGLPMKLKYDCPPPCRHNDDKTPLWKLATSRLLSVLVQGLEALDKFEKQVSIERFAGVWRILVDVLEGSLLSPSSPPESMKLEELDADEHFDISVLNAVQNDIVIYMKPRVSIETVQKLINVIRDSSRLYYIENRESGNSGSTDTIVPVMKEAFGYAAFLSLFSLCSAQKKDHQQVRKRIAKVAAPVLLERCETILRNYTADEPLLGRCPFPRVRKEEVLFILKQSIMLEMQTNSLAIEEKTNPVKKLLLSGPRAHLFYLYPSLCSMIMCEDDAIISLIQECLQVTGIEMGVSSSLL